MLVQVVPRLPNGEVMQKAKIDEAYYNSQRRKRLLQAAQETRKLSPITLMGSACGRRFTFSVAEQKIFAKRNLQPPSVVSLN